MRIIYCINWVKFWFTIELRLNRSHSGTKWDTICHDDYHVTVLSFVMEFLSNLHSLLLLFFFSCQLRETLSHCHYHFAFINEPHKSKAHFIFFLFFHHIPSALHPSFDHPLSSSFFSSPLLCASSYASVICFILLSTDFCKSACLPSLSYFNLHAFHICNNFFFYLIFSASYFISSHSIRNDQPHFRLPIISF